MRVFELRVAPSVLAAWWGGNRYIRSVTCAVVAWALATAGILCVHANAQTQVSLQEPSSEYRLAPQDKIKLRILEWRPGSGEYKEWTALNGEYAIGSSGAIDVPLIGRVNAQNLTPKALSNVIALRLKTRVRLAEPPDVSIEIATHRPVYIVGEVQQPGAFPFQPGMNTLKLVAIAGGLFRDGASTRGAEQNKITAERALEQAIIGLRRAYVRRARLAAELALVESLSFERVEFLRPSELRGANDIDKLMLDETRILKARIAGFESQHLAFMALIKLLEQESSTLQQKAAEVEKQLNVATKQNAKVQKLWEKRLTSSAARLIVERDLAQLKERMLDLETSSLRVKQDTNKAKRDVDNARSTYLAQVTTELQQTDANIDTLKGTVLKERALLKVALSSLPARAKLGQSQNPMDKVIFMIKRATVPGVESQSIHATQLTPVRPGDIVIVTVPDDDPVQIPRIGIAREKDSESSSDNLVRNQDRKYLR